MSKPKEYVWIKRWGEYMRSKPDYIKEQQRLASEENVLLTVIYYSEADNIWYTTSNITNPVTRLSLGLST